MRLILILILVILIYRGKFFGQNRNVVTRNCSELFVDNFNSFGGEDWMILEEIYEF